MHVNYEPLIKILYIRCMSLHSKAYIYEHITYMYIV